LVYLVQIDVALFLRRSRPINFFEALSLIVLDVFFSSLGGVGDTVQLLNGDLLAVLLKFVQFLTTVCGDPFGAGANLGYGFLDHFGGPVAKPNAALADLLSSVFPRLGRQQQHGCRAG
jgi:hypothetical protein